MVDQGAALGSAQAHLGQSGMSSGDAGMSGLFAQGLAMAQSYGVNKNPQDIDLDGDGVISAYERAYAQGGAQGGQNQGGQMDAQSMGAAAAMKAMKSFTGGGGGGAAAASSGGNMQSKVGRHVFSFTRTARLMICFRFSSSVWQWLKP
ncbi:hypothetical protein QFC22_002478 [Naganishia vaughanmartiniae]|uniref:Uncharacterized protein n=1 Tax=Naganishia vaughanmartiniae TaxID=1424756 RepID=A0ACC2XCW1_9TREE|nr:hypothetical protein QFC22_002478 [Naganishia vaughanmartiniae]